VTRSIGELRHLIENNPIKFKSSQDRRIKKLVKKILKKNPWERPSCKEILIDSDLLTLMKDNGLEHKYRAYKRQLIARNQ
jgi:serine/threonine protein kinase